MDKEYAIRLLDETFSNDFDINRFFKFIKELFKKIEIRERDCTQYITKEYEDYISSLIKLGDYEDTKKRSIEILIVKLNKTSSRDRARTMQRNFIANWLGKYDKYAALVAFYGDDEDWRFSFVKMEYNFVKEETGKVKIVEELTPAKRYSFLVGKNEPNHTCKKQFLKLIEEENINPSLEEIEEAFSIENVTKEFFLEYKELYLKLKESLDNLIEKNQQVKNDFKEKNISTVDFSKKLLGQIVFIYFLQKKGWLGVEKDEKGIFNEWGTGPKRFLRKLFNKEIVAYENFFSDILEPLFYEALATERDDDYYSRFKCKIPFLNGGLFEPINDYDWTGNEILLGNKIFENIINTFDRFNFTVKEDEPLEKEVAIDPEMLGKVFENLLEIKDRRSTGRFYTTREIVHYMCQQSLINYLETNADITKKDIEKFILLGDSALNVIIKEQEQIKKYGKSYNLNERYNIPKIIKDNYLIIDKLLKDIKIVDPAVGSGAFPVGMMNEIVKARSILTMFFKNDEQKERTSYNLKREAIENSLYGVDNDPSAVDIAKLRFWLSLIVDEIDMKNIKPLPNLDHKIMCGNSLLEEFEGIKLFDEKLFGDFKEDYSFEIKRIDEKITELYNEKRDIALGKINSRSIKEVERDIKKLERQKENIKNAKDKERNLTLSEISERKIKESQKKLFELEKLQKEYFNEQNRKFKKQLKDDIDRIEWELIEETLKEQGNEEAMKRLKQYKKNKAKPFFLWKLYFAEVFQRENPGFDVVIANPPYLEARSPDFTEEMKNNLQSYVINDFYDGSLIQKGSDLLIYFYVKSVQLVRTSGFIAFISQNSWLDTDYGKRFQDFIIKHTKIKAIIDSDYKHFDTANINTIITFFIGHTSELKENVFFLRYHKNFDRITYSFSKIEDGTYSKEDLEVKSFSTEDIKEMDYKWGLLLYSDAIFMDILKIMKKNGKKIDNIKQIEVKCGQGLNLTKDFFVEKGITSFVDAKALIPIMTNKDGAPYELKNTHYFLLNKELLSKDKVSELNKRGIKVFDKNKINKIQPTLILPRGVGRHYCSFNSINAYSSSAVDIYLGEGDNSIKNMVSKRLWVFLNSSLLWLVREISGRKNLGGGMLKAEATDIKQFELYFEFDIPSCESLFNKLKNQEASDTIEEISTTDHKKLDEMVFNYLELSKKQMDYIIEKLKIVLKNRASKASSR